MQKSESMVGGTWNPIYRAQYFFRAIEYRWNQRNLANDGRRDRRNHFHPFENLPEVEHRRREPSAPTAIWIDPGASRSPQTTNHSRWKEIAGRIQWRWNPSFPTEKSEGLSAARSKANGQLIKHSKTLMGMTLKNAVCLSAFSIFLAFPADVIYNASIIRIITLSPWRKPFTLWRMFIY